MPSVTHLGRRIDLSVPSNRAAVAMSVAAGVLGFVLSSGGAGPRLLDAAVAAIASFLAWALGREIDPDRNATAALAAVGGGIAAAGLEGVALGALYLLMVTARILVRTTGLAPTVPDLAVNLVIAAIVAWFPSGWLAGMGLAVALVRDTGLPDPAPRRQAWWGVATGVVVSVVAGLSNRIGEWRVPSPLELVVLALGVGGAVVLLRPEEPRSRADITGAPLSGLRLRWARGVVTAALALTAALAGGFGVAATFPAWLALLAGGVGRRSAR